MVLRDSFVQSDKNKIIMLACICPGSSSADHTLNTLRYAERLKERSGNPQANNQNIPVGPTTTTYSPGTQLDDQLKLFKKQSSLKYITNDQNQQQQPIQQQDQNQLRKGQTVIPPKQAAATTVTRESIPLKPNKDMFYHQQQQQNNSFSDYDNEIAGGGDDDMLQLENEVNNRSQQQLHQQHSQTKPQPVTNNLVKN